MEGFDEGGPVEGLVVGAVDEDEVVGFGHCCGGFVVFSWVLVLWLFVMRVTWYREFLLSKKVTWHDPTMTSRTTYMSCTGDAKHLFQCRQWGFVS